MPRKPATKDGRRHRNPLINKRDPRHGTLGGYRYHGCRCDLCRECAYKNGVEYRERRAAQMQPEDHGKATTYVNCNCRCEPCKQAMVVENAKKAKRKYNGPAVDLGGLA